jgi:hypothetical protein
MTETLISKPSLLVDLPEVSAITSEFVYNFFQPDERTNESSDTSGLGYTSTSVDLTSESSFTNNVGTTNITDANLLAFYGRKTTYPRFVRISFTKPSADIDYLGSISLPNNLDNFARESALNVFGRTGTSIVDTELDQTIYTALSGALASSTTQETGTASQRLLSAIQNSIQPDGYRYAQTDARAGTSNTIVEKLQGLEFGFSYASNTAGTIANASLRLGKSIYSDEISSTSEDLNDIEAAAIVSSDPYTIARSNYESTFNFYSESFDPFGSFDSLKNVVVGYVIQKFGTNSDGTVQIFDERLVLNPNASSILDPNVAYGRRYRYRVITLYACKFQVSQQIAVSSTFGLEEDRTITKYALFASSGTDTTVTCEENIAPPPPVDLRFRFRADNTGLNITWNFPLNLQQDIKKFQIFRRRTAADPFQLIKVYDFDDSEIKTPDPELVPERFISRSLFPVTLHSDTEFTKDSKFIYAVCAIDAHGLTSNYSVQLEATYDRYKNRINTRVISRSSAPKTYPNIFLNQDTFVDTMKMSGYTRLRVYFNPEYVAVTNQSGVDLGHVKFNNSSGDDNTYKLMITNTDFQQSKTVDIKINNSYIEPPVITPSSARVFFP